MKLNVGTNASFSVQITDRIRIWFHDVDHSREFNVNVLLNYLVKTETVGHWHGITLRCLY